jgi:hypothetical protein
MATSPKAKVERWMRHRPFRGLLAILFALWGCGGAAIPPAHDESEEGSHAVRLLPSGDTPRFRFRALDGREVSSDVALGRTSVIAFMATFDWASQAQARFISGIERHHTPRVNCFGIVMEQAENAPLVESFVTTLGLRFPVAHVTSSQVGKATLGVRTVPTVLVMDAGGNVIWRSRGLATEDQLREVLHAVEAQTKKKVK